MSSPFDHCAQDYAAARPPYPEVLLDALLDYLKKASHSPVDPQLLFTADIGAGTGIFTRHLAQRSLRGVAFDIGPALLAELVSSGLESGSSLAGWSAACGRAEQCPLRDSSVDLVTVAQAFHWFNPRLAFAELARILRPGGVVALVWNNREVESSSFWQAYEALIERFNPAYEREYRRQDWPFKAEQSGLFEPMIHRQFRWEWSIEAAQLLGYARSISYIRNVLSTERMGEFLRELSRLWTDFFADKPGGLPMVTDLYLTRRHSRL